MDFSKLKSEKCVFEDGASIGIGICNDCVNCKYENMNTSDDEPEWSELVCTVKKIIIEPEYEDEQTKECDSFEQKPK